MQSVIISSGVLVTIIAFARVPTLWVLLLGHGQLPGLPNDPAGRWWSWWWCGITPVILLQEHFYTIHHITIIILGTIGLVNKFDRVRLHKFFGQFSDATVLSEEAIELMLPKMDSIFCYTG